MPRTIEVLESRALLANGITPVAGPAISATVAVPITNAVFATYTIADATGEPGQQWRAQITFGDGKVDKQVAPVQVGSVFEFVDSHTYTAPGTYTVTVMIAVPGSHSPNDNLVTTQVTVTTPSPTPTPTPTPSPKPTPTPPTSIGSFNSTRLSAKVKAMKPFRGRIARFGEPHTTARGFSALVDWGDQSSPTSGKVQLTGKGRYVVNGSHRYLTAGIYHVMVTIQNSAGQEIVAISTMRVTR